MTTPQKEVSLFIAKVSKDIECHKELIQAIYNKKNQARLESMLVQQFALSLGVSWEIFISDLLITYVAVTPRRFVEGLTNRISQSVENKFGSEARRLVNFDQPANLSRIKVSALLDRNAWNITFKSAQDMASRANEYMGGRDARKFSLDEKDALVFDYTIALRNFLAHNSTSSRSVLKDAISRLSDPVNKPLQSSLTHIGPYLKSNVGSGLSRVEYLTNRLVQIAERLV